MTASKSWLGGVTAAVLAGLTYLASVLLGDQTLADLTTAQWIGFGIAVIGSFGVVQQTVYHVSNSPSEPTASQEAAILDKYTAPIIPAVTTVQSGGQGNGDITATQ